MFDHTQISNRLDKSMPKGKFDLMQSYSQTEIPMEYTGGMFWTSGFKTYKYCEAATLWAYNSANSSSKNYDMSISKIAKSFASYF